MFLAGVRTSMSRLVRQGDSVPILLATRNRKILSLNWRLHSSANSAHGVHQKRIEGD
jgi:hypothetical protein